MKPHKYPMILAKMDQQQISRETISKILNISANAWTNKIRGNSEITLKESYKILKTLKIPATAIHEYFPEREEDYI